MIFGVSTPLIRRKIHAPIASWNSCLNYALTPSLVNLGSLTLNPHRMLISFGKFTRWLRHGITTWIPYSFPLGQYALNITCPSGISYGNSQDGSSVLGIPIYLGMNGTLLAVHLSSILFVVELVEGKEYPPPRWYT